MKTKTATCDEHGDYQLQCIDLLGRQSWVGSCKPCSAAKQENEHRKEHAEKIRRLEAKKLANGIGKRLLNKTFDDFHTDPECPNQDIAKRQFMKLAELIKSKDETFNIIGVGGVGTGKTLLASAIVDELINDGKRAKITKAMDMIREIRETWDYKSQKNERQLLSDYSTMELLVIDEIGTQYGKDAEKQHIFDVIDGRYRNMKPTILLSNLTMDQVKKVVGDRVIDRLREGGGSLVVFDWQSNRGPKEIN